MDVFVKASALHKDFSGLKAVQDVSLEVAKGEVLGFLGPNGAGKTTTMRMITGYLPPSAGSVEVAGLDVWRSPVEAQRHIGYLPEGAPLYPEMTPHQLLRFIADIRKLPASFFKAQYDKVVAHLNLESVLYQPIETLSKGFKRRVGMAQALVHEPDVLVLDEPTDGLDPLQKREVRGLIKQMAKEKAIIISTHILEEVDAVCSRALIIADGKTVADGTPKELRSRYKKDSLDDIFCELAKGRERSHA